jgi:hypothetical protein
MKVSIVSIRRERGRATNRRDSLSAASWVTICKTISISCVYVWVGTIAFSISYWWSFLLKANKSKDVLCVHTPALSLWLFCCSDERKIVCWFRCFFCSLNACLSVCLQGAKITLASHFDFEYVLGHKIAFLCIARGNPRPTITWWVCVCSATLSLSKLYSLVSPRYKDGAEIFSHLYLHVGIHS